MLIQVHVSGQLWSEYVTEMVSGTIGGATARTTLNYNYLITVVCNM